MVGINQREGVRGQIVAIAWLRWRLFVHSLRTTRGQMEVFSRIVVGLVLAIGAIGGAFGLGAGAWFLVSQGKSEWLAILLWPVFGFWQLFPIFAAAFTENTESGNLLRFPLSYPAYFLVRVAYGALDPASAMGMLWLAGIAVGAGVAAPRILPAAIPALATFAALNILLSRMLFAWLERWLAQRKTREILGVLFILAMLSLQLVGPLVKHYAASRMQMLEAVGAIAPVQRALPPGLAGEVMAQSLSGDFGEMLKHFLGLCAYGIVILGLLSMRLRQEYRGEDLSEAGPRTEKKQLIHNRGWGFSRPAAMVMEKELRYLSRSGPMLFTLIVPLFMLVIFRSNGAFPHHKPDLVFPAVAGYTLILLTNLIYNNFGGDGTGIQFYFAAPVKFREIVAGKNLAHVTVLMLELLVAWIGVSWIYRPPTLNALAATLAGILFAAPLNLAAGNLLSLYFPKRIDAAAFGRQRASATTVLISFGIQIVVMGTAALTIWLTGSSGRYSTATLIFLGLAAITMTGYILALNRTDKIAMQRREILLAELMKT